jgi:hypothetical protein
LFIKFFPSVAITEIKEIIPPPMRRGGHGHGAAAGHNH